MSDEPDKVAGEFLHQMLDPELPPGPPYTHTLSLLPQYTCGACGETFGTNCGPDDIECPECDSRLCEHCGKWSGTAGEPVDVAKSLLGALERVTDALNLGEAQDIMGLVSEFVSDWYSEARGEVEPHHAPYTITELP